MLATALAETFGLEGEEDMLGCAVLLVPNDVGALVSMTVSWPGFKGSVSSRARLDHAHRTSARLCSQFDTMDDVPTAPSASVTKYAEMYIFDSHQLVLGTNENLERQQTCPVSVASALTSNPFPDMSWISYALVRPDGQLAGDQ
ncbi:hypothetical protein MKZ38_010099 [Zalerion maritima]|uniref:Uncharacterized protein n=1 Tax=Zalerion maritima TaxID=339359 RepID=A0AAD5WM52_9PEZI|nr:hypothetical protein MKZ38_010099 [Zalerion maritima]